MVLLPEGAPLFLGVLFRRWYRWLLVGRGRRFAILIEVSDGSCLQTWSGAKDPFRMRWVIAAEDTWIVHFQDLVKQPHRTDCAAMDEEECAVHSAIHPFAEGDLPVSHR